MNKPSASSNSSSRRPSLFSGERLGQAAFLLLLAEALLIILSWLLSATRLEGIRSLLSSEGIRWFFGSFTTIVASPYLVYLLLILITLGTLRATGLTRVLSSLLSSFSSSNLSSKSSASKSSSSKSSSSKSFSSKSSASKPFSSNLSFRSKLSLRTSLVFLLLYLLIIALLTLPPHAILLSSTGHLFPSAFSRALIPIICFGLCLVSIVFGFMSGRLRTFSDTLHALSQGLSTGSPLIILYILLMQFIASLRFVFF